jgi:hypothetical protein
VIVCKLAYLEITCIKSLFCQAFISKFVAWFYIQVFQIQQIWVGTMKRFLLQSISVLINAKKSSYANNIIW